MQIIPPLIRQIAIMFILMGVGALFRRKGWLSGGAARDLGKLLLNLVMPAVIIKSFWIGYTPERAAGLSVALALSAALLVLAMLVARAVQPRDGIAQFSVAFSNAGFIGIPLIQATLGEEAVCYVAPFIALLNALQWTYGQYLLTGSREHVRPRQALLNPMVIALVLGLALFYTRMPSIAFAGTLLESVGALNSPLAMIILGCYLAESDIRALAKRCSLYLVSLERLIVIPALSAGLLALIPCSVDIKLALLIAAATPTGANVAIFAQQQGCDHRYACSIVCATTLASLVTIPLVIAAASALM